MNYSQTKRVLCFVAAVPLLISAGSIAQAQTKSPLIGRWDLTETRDGVESPSWLEVRKSGFKTLVGSFCGSSGSARPIAKITTDGDSFRFAIPPQWSESDIDMVVEGNLDGETMTGTFRESDGSLVDWKGARAPSLKRQSEPEWDDAMELFNGKDTSGWKAVRSGSDKHGWVAENGLLSNKGHSKNIATEAVFEDFKLHAEFRYPKGSNSGIYLRGRYEIQISDDFGKPADSHYAGGIYGHLTPSSNAALEHDQWQTMDVELVGRKVTIHLNGERIIDRATIPGITGGALDSNEGAPGPLYLQGDHGPISFRKLTITPAKKAQSD